MVSRAGQYQEDRCRHCRGQITRSGVATGWSPWLHKANGQVGCSPKSAEPQMSFLTISLRLPGDLLQDLDEHVANGRYASRSELVRQAIELLLRTDGVYPEENVVPR